MMHFYSERSGFIKCSSSQSFTRSRNTLNASQQSKSSQDNDDPWDIQVQASTKKTLFIQLFIYLYIQDTEKVQFKHEK